MKKFKKVIALAAASILVLSLLNGCTTAQKESAEKTDEKKIGMVVSTLNNPFFVTMKNAAEAKAKELGYTLVVLDSQNKADKELSNVEDLIQQNVSVLLINPTNSDAVVNAVRAANNKKIPVITLDRASNGGEVVSHIASDNVAGGKMAGEFILEKLNGKGKVVELQGVPGTSAATDRGKGFNDAIADNQDIQVVAQQPADFDRQKGMSVMENILQANPEIDAVFAHNDEMALGAMQAIDAAKRTGILVVGFDATEDAVKAVNDGKMSATVAQQPDLIGSLGIENADKVLKGEKVEKSIPVELKLITK